MDVRRFGRVALAGTVALLILAPVALSAQADPRRRAVGDWLVEEAYDDVGRRIFRMTRESGDYRLDYHLNLGTGLEGEASQGFLVWRLNCGQGGEESLARGVADVEAATVRRRFADYLGRCDTPDGEAADLLQGFERGFVLLTQWGAEMETAWDAVDNAASAAEAAAESMDVDMEVVDGAGPIDMNVTNSVEPD